MQGMVRSPSSSYKREDPPKTPLENTPTPETINYSADEPSSDGILKSLTRFLNPSAPAGPLVAANSAANIQARGAVPARARNELFGLRSKKWTVTKSQPPVPSKSASRPGKLISSDPKQAGFIDLIRTFFA